MGDIRDNPKGFIHRMVLPTRHMLLVWYLASTWRQANWSKGKEITNLVEFQQQSWFRMFFQSIKSNWIYPIQNTPKWPWNNGETGGNMMINWSTMMIPPQVVTGPHIHRSQPQLSRDHTEVFSHFRNWTTMSRKFSTSNGWFDPSLTRAWKWIQGAKPSHLHQGSYETAYFGSQGYWAIPNCAFYDSDRAFPTTK